MPIFQDAPVPHASVIPYTPTGTIAASTVQTAIDETASESGAPDVLEEAPRIHPVCYAIAEINIDVTNPGATLDGVPFSANKRWCLVAQTTGNQNGIWLTGATSSTPMTRPTDWTGTTTVQYGDIIIGGPSLPFSSGPYTMWQVKPDTGGGTSPSYVNVGTTAPVIWPLWEGMGVHGVDVASASTVVLSSTKGSFVNITGTTTINNFDILQGQIKFVRFSGALTLAHNASQTVLPGGTNITTAAGDTAIFIGANNATFLCYCLAYQKASGNPINPGSLDDICINGGTIASAATLDLDDDSKHLWLVSGTTTITAISIPQAGAAIRILKFGGSLTLTHNASSLILPTGANIQTAAGDTAIFTPDPTAVAALCIGYYRANGKALVETATGTNTGDDNGISKAAAATIACGSNQTWLVLASNSSDITGTGLTTVMAVSGVAAGRYSLRCQLIYQSSATGTGHEVAVNHTGTVTQFLMENRYSSTGGTAATAAHTEASTDAANNIYVSQGQRTKDTAIGVGSVSVDAADTDMMTTIEGFFVVSVSGDLQIKLAAESAGLVVRAMQGSNLQLLKLSA